MWRLACFFKWHSWSAFLHIPSRCVDERFCKHCQITESSVRHRWEKWEHINQNTIAHKDGQPVVVSTRTVQSRHCADCNIRDLREDHL